MDVKMHTIKAGPDGCADAGTTITVSGDEARRLIDGKYAVAVSRPKRETAMVDPARQEQIDREQAEALADVGRAKEANSKTAESVGKALDALDTFDDEDWTSSGKPAMGRVKELTGSTTLTRAELTVLFPDFSRPDSGDEGGEPKTTDPAPAPRGASGARSSAL